MPTSSDTITSEIGFGGSLSSESGLWVKRRHLDPDLTPTHGPRACGPWHRDKSPMPPRPQVGRKVAAYSRPADWRSVSHNPTALHDCTQCCAHSACTAHAVLSDSDSRGSHAPLLALHTTPLPAAGHAQGRRAEPPLWHICPPSLLQSAALPVAAACTRPRPAPGLTVPGALSALPAWLGV